MRPQNAAPAYPGPMVDVSLAATAIRTGFTEGFVYSTDTLPTGRVCSDGTRPILITNLSGAISGRGATRSATMYVGSSSVALSRASAGSASDTGWVNSSDWLSYSGSVNYGYSGLSGSCYFGRSANGTGFAQGAFGTWDESVGMSVRYYESPTAPTIASVVPSEDGESATVTITAPSDSGGLSLTGYRVQRATNAAFTEGLATISSAGTSVVVTGLTPGVRYYYRATARNLVTDTASKLGGAWSATVSAQQPEPTSGGRIRIGGVWLDAEVRRYNGSSWQVAEGRRFNGSSWQPIG